MQQAKTDIQKQKLLKAIQLKMANAWGCIYLLINGLCDFARDISTIWVAIA